MSGGRIAGELPAGATQDEIMALAVANVDDHVEAEPTAIETEARA